MVKGLEVNYEVRGAGDYVFLLHGWGSSLKPFDGLAAAIAGKYTAVSLDFPGFGLSEEPKEPWDVGAYSDFLVDFIAGFGCRRAVLLGHSFGGRVIIKTCARRDLPFAVDKVVLTGSAGIRPKRSLAYRLKVGSYKLGKKVLNWGVARAAFPDALETFRKKLGSSDYSGASEVMRGVLVKTVNEDLRPLLGLMEAPALLIWGEDDPVTPLADGRLMESLIPDAGLAALKGAGHYAFLDQPYAFHKIVKYFLEID
ncbi:MAG: alpha/beta hydrolase [Clostridiales Family XIII bacterium]|nr:alpha/beta hydrolase [Clostridiales Family XIII bacterium]